MKRSLSFIVLLIILTLYGALPAMAAVRLPALFSDNMVLQQGSTLPVWGWAEPGEQVRVTLNGQSVSGAADRSGRWQISLPAMKAGGPLTMTVSGSNKLTVNNILVGEVWVGSGQSNMAMRVNASKNAAQEIAAANYPEIRMFTVAVAASGLPLHDCKGSWVVCSPQTAGSFSAAGYYFIRELYKDLKVPMGFINTSWGGTAIEPWIPLTAMGVVPSGKAQVAALNRQTAVMAEGLYGIAPELRAWLNEADRAKAAQKPLPVPPFINIADPRSTSRSPGAIYNAMVAPLLPFAMAGAVWYQGEANGGVPVPYRSYLPLLINSWRQVWGRGDFPFLVVQLPNYLSRVEEPVQEGSWAELREAQAMSMRVSNTGMAVTIDIGEARNIHPVNKQDVGRRLALIALARTYGRQVEYSGPLFDRMTVEGSRARIYFKYADRGLQALNNGPVKGFAIAGEDGKFHHAEAVIDGNTVLLSSAAVKIPSIVRYGWANNPECTLYNKAGLPAAPFRTDAPQPPELPDTKGIR